MPVRTGSGALKYPLPSQAAINAQQSAASASSGGSAAASTFGDRLRFAGQRRQLQADFVNSALDRNFRGSAILQGQQFDALQSERGVDAGIESDIRRGVLELPPKLQEELNKLDNETGKGLDGYQLLEFNQRKEIRRREILRSAMASNSPTGAELFNSGTVYVDQAGVGYNEPGAGRVAYNAENRQPLIEQPDNSKAMDGIYKEIASIAGEPGPDSKPMSWDQAVAEYVKRQSSLRDTFGGQSVAGGNPAPAAAPVAAPSANPVQAPPPSSPVAAPVAPADDRKKPVVFQGPASRDIIMDVQGNTMSAEQRRAAGVAATKEKLAGRMLRNPQALAQVAGQIPGGHAVANYAAAVPPQQPVQQQPVQNQATGQASVEPWLRSDGLPPLPAYPPKPAQNQPVAAPSGTPGVQPPPQQAADQQRQMQEFISEFSKRPQVADANKNIERILKENGLADDVDPSRIKNPAAREEIEFWSRVMDAEAYDEPVQVKSIEEARKLKSGTKFIRPDGKTMVVP